MTGYFLQAFIYLFAAVIAVPIAKRLGLGSVLGYLIAGVVIGPIIGLVGEETTTIQHFAEFGVVMMLFLVGLELEPKMLWGMRNRLMGLGGLQVSGTTAIVMGIALFFGQPWTIALTIGLIFALSSTAIVLQTFNEKGLAKTEGGQNAFSVLLFQDIAVIPMLAFIPLLALPELIEKAQLAAATAAEHHDEISIVAGLPGWAYGLVITASIALVVVGGHYLSRPLFRFVASSGLREIFTATALMLVIGIAALMSLVGLSPALGTFLAGVVLANSEFRHELESNIDPFKGLLLGLFFITVGAGIDFGISRTVNDYRVAVHFAYEGGTVTNGPFNGGGTTESFRGYLTVANDHYGEVKIGRDYGVFGIDVILSDMSLLGVGASAIIKSPLNTTLGSSGYGYIFVDRLAQINYSFPTKNGLSATVGVYQPLDPSTLGAENTFVGDSGSKTPGFHGKLKYEFEKGFISSTWLTQQIDNNEVNETAFAWDVTGKMNFGALSLVASYHDAKGVGHSGLFFDGIDAQGNARNSNGYFVQAMYSFTDTRVGINYGISTLDRNANDPLVNLKQSEKLTFGAYHSLFEGLTLVAEVSMYESENNKNQSIDNLGLNLGAVYFF
jgi:monovalent cation:proton antiporter-2 (CPA2) family protein